MEGIKEYKGEEKKGISSEGVWTEQDLAVKADQPLIDSATGEPFVIRMFDFKWNPLIKLQQIREAKSRKQELFNAHAKYIRDFLWKDGLKVREDHDPRLIFNKTGYRIAVLCQPRSGVGVFEKPTTLQRIFSFLNKKK